MSSDDSDQSKVQPTIVNFSARFEREINEIETLLALLAPKNKAVMFEQIDEKLDLIYNGLNVLMDQEENLSQMQKAEIQLLQRHVLLIKHNLKIKSTSDLIALTQSLHKQLKLVLDVK